MLRDSDRGQVNTEAAEVYERFFLPALFQQWPERVLDAAGVEAGQRVLDVACGTGVLARAARKRVGQDGHVVGVDVNSGMLAVARRMEKAIEWRQETAEDLPFPDDHFDRVVSQFGLMFFENRDAAIGEMVRVLRPGGRLAVAVWAPLEQTPGYAAMVELLEELFGATAADALRAPYNLGDISQLAPMFDHPRLVDVRIETLDGTARFPSLADWTYTDVKGWTLADVLNDAQYQRLLQAAQVALNRFVTMDGSVAFPAPAHIVAASRC